MHGKGTPQSMLFPLDYYNRELVEKPKGIKHVLKERGLWLERRLDWSAQPHTIGQAVHLGAAAALVKVVCKRRLRHGATKCFFTPSPIVSMT